jgi:hypothetical protein
MIATRRRNHINNISPEMRRKMIATRLRTGSYHNPHIRGCCGHTRTGHPLRRCD